ncbi:hypothetical protein IAD21_03886 [Abditibacteriota bacterium]|nr:hypothetical protein IAD21_03886 [Abditibacteriota bacterium]
MQSSLISLESIEIASPCRADWDAMQGNQCVRFCPSCGKNVYNISAMARDEAMRLIEQKEGNLCLRLRRRADGTVLTNDCPIGETAHKRQKRGIQMFAGAMGFVAALFGLHSLKAALSPDTPSPDQTGLTTMGDFPPNPNAPMPNLPVPNVSGPTNALGMDAPSSVTTAANDPNQVTVTMGAPIPAPLPTETPSPTHT